MTGARKRWAGVDVGASKGFDVAAIDESGLVDKTVRIADALDVVRWLREQGARVVAVDSPRSPAPEGKLSRRGERDLVKAGVCGIRYTPNVAALDANPSYYAWIAHGFALYAALAAVSSAARWTVIECFPTATWSRLGGPKGNLSRARWSREVLHGLGLRGLPRRMNQDARDAVGAAITARLYDQGKAEPFDEIIVPLGRNRLTTLQALKARSA
jgi:predicted nuclease with RNAse H fold